MKAHNKPLTQLQKNFLISYVLYTWDWLVVKDNAVCFKIISRNKKFTKTWRKNLDGSMTEIFVR